MMFAHNASRHGHRFAHEYLVEDGGGGPVAAEGEELEPPANAPPANEEPVAPAPAAAQTTNQSTNVRGLNLEDSWTLQEHVDTGQGQRDSG